MFKGERVGEREGGMERSKEKEVDAIPLKQRLLVIRQIRTRDIVFLIMSKHCKFSIIKSKNLI